MVTFRQPGTIITDRSFLVPLDHAQPGGAPIELFAREVAAPGREADSLPWLLFLQGGPGFGAPRPAGRDGWLERALRDYRVLLLDQRGTGRSTPGQPADAGRARHAAGAGRVPDALPGRLDRRRRRADQAPG